MAEETLDGPVASVRRRPFRTGKGRWVVGGLLLTVAFAYLGYLGFQGSAVYYFTVAEAVGRTDQAPGETLRVSGKLAPGSFERAPGGTVATFALVDPETGHQMAMTHDGVVPDLFFNEQSEIVVEGALDADGTFQSDLVIVKCPTKYSAEAEDA